MSTLYSKATLGLMTLQNHLVMAPMTRSRATDNIPNTLMLEYYVQRATAGLIITEGTSPSPNGLGYPRIPGIFSPTQVEGWKRITDAVPGLSRCHWNHRQERGTGATEKGASLICG